MRLLIVSVAAATLALAACKKESTNPNQPTDITGETPSSTSQIQLTPAAPEATAPAAPEATAPAAPATNNTAPVAPATNTTAAIAPAPATTGSTAPLASTNSRNS